MADSKISGLSSATILAFADLLEIVQGGANKQITAALLAELANGSFIYQNADRTLTSSTAQQKIFDQVSNGTYTIPETGLYEFASLLNLTTMSATSGNAAFSLIGAGGATLAGQLLFSIGLDNTTLTTPAAMGGAVVQAASAFTTNTVTAGTGTALGVRVNGVFKCTATGTIIPSVALQTANAAVVKAGSWFRIRKVANASVFNGNGWS